MRLLTAVLLPIWAILVLYPNPLYLPRSIVRAWSPPIDTQAVRELVARLPDDPRAIEAAVNHSIVVYAVPWETYGVPWYFPNVTEVLARGQGDCQARAIVLASILEAKGIQTTLVGSFDHLWVDYPGKHPNVLENTALALAKQDTTGVYQFHWPRLIDWRMSWEIERAYFWDAMPVLRRWLLLGGWTLIILVPALPLRRKTRRAGSAAEPIA